MKGNNGTGRGNARAFTSLPDGVQFHSYKAAVEEIERSIVDVDWFLRALGGETVDSRLVLGIVVERFEKKYGGTL